MEQIELISCSQPERITILNRELHDHHARLYPDVFKPWDYEALLPAFTELLGREDVTCIILQVDGNDAGYLLGWPILREENGFQYERRVWYIDHISVFADYRGKGLSRVLLDKARQLADAERCSRLEIHHWTGNSFAEKSFEALGFRQFNHKLELPL